MMTNSDPLFDTASAAEYLDASIPTLERWRRAGEGPDFCKLGGNVRYRKSALDRFIEVNTRSPARAKRSKRNVVLCETASA